MTRKLNAKVIFCVSSRYVITLNDAKQFEVLYFTKRNIWRCNFGTILNLRTKSKLKTCFLMFVFGSGLWKCPVTFEALIWFFISVSSFMWLQTTRACKLPFTKWALMGLLPIMYSLMPFEARYLSICFITFAATAFAFTCVNHLMGF